MARCGKHACDQRTKPFKRLTLEQPTDKTLEAAAELIGKAWYQNEPASWHRACEGVELAHHLGHATYVRTAMLDGDFAGIIAVRATNPHDVAKSSGVHSLWYQNRLLAIAPWFAGTSDETAVGVALAPVATEMVLTQEFLNSGDSRSAWEITLLVIGPAFQGNGIGKALLADAIAYLRHHGVAGFFLATDDGCDFGFYDHLGLERIATKEMPTGASAQQTHQDGNAAAFDRENHPFHVYLYGAGGAGLGGESDGH